MGIYNKIHIIKQINRLFWVLPFLSFIASYLFFSYFLGPYSFETPCLIGKELINALQILSDHNLNARILSQKEDTTTAPGTIISQVPATARKIRAHQSVFLVVSKLPEPRLVPDLRKKNKEEIEHFATEHNITINYYYFSHHYPAHTCIGQIPETNQPLIDNRMIVYLSQDNKHKPTLVPSFKQQLVSQVQSFLDEHAIKYTIIHARPVESTHQCIGCKIIDQKPLAGSLLDIKKTLYVQLYVQ